MGKRGVGRRGVGRRCDWRSRRCGRAVALGRRFGLGAKSHRSLAAGARQLVGAGDVAQHAEAAIAAKIAVAVKHRKSRQLDREPLARLVDRPRQRDAAPGLVRGDRARHLVVGIEVQFGGDLAPQPAERRRRARPHELDELVRADGEAAVRIHLPDEAQRMAALARRNVDCGSLGRRQDQLDGAGVCLRRRRTVRERFRWRGRWRGDSGRLACVRLRTWRCFNVQGSGRGGGHLLDGPRTWRRFNVQESRCSSRRLRGGQGTRRRFSVGGRRRGRRRWRARFCRSLFRKNFACPRSKHQHQDGRSIAAEALDGDRSVGCRAAGAAVDEGGGGDGVDAERRQRRRADKARERRFGRIKKRALAGEGRERTPAIGKQPAHTLAERQRRPRRLGGDDQDDGRAVGENEARANTGERAAEVGTETAQAFEPRLARRRQGRSQTDDLRGGRVLGAEPALLAFARVRRSEDRGADGVRPDDARSVRAPEPRGGWARGMGRELCGELRIAQRRQH